MAIDVTNVDLRELAKAAYDLSAPKGMGMMHFKPGGLSDAEVDRFLRASGTCALSMDYVNGRAVKLHVSRGGDMLVIGDSWYDHTDMQYTELLSRVGITRPVGATDHGQCCECRDCKA